MNRKELNALKYVANENILKILDALGIDYNETYLYVYSSCPIHNGDRENGWSWHLDYKVWSCFTRGCHETYGKDIYGLVRGVLDCKFPEAVEFIKKAIGNKNIDISDVLHQKNNKEFVNKAKKKEPTIYPEECLDKLIYHAYLETRGYPRELIESYQIGISGNKYKRMSNRIIIPVRNIKGELVGFTGRTLFKDWKERKIGKWEHSYGFYTADNLFNIDRAAKHIKESGEVILCEGPLDVLRLEQSGIHNSVAIFGRKLQPGQITLLMKVGGVNKITLAFDGDTAGKTGSKDAFKSAKDFFEVGIIDLGSGDVGDMSIEKVREVFCV